MSSPNEKLYDFLAGQVAPYKGPLPSMWAKFLVKNGFSNKPIQKGIYRYLGSLGYRGVFAKRWAEWYDDNFVSQSNVNYISNILGAGGLDYADFNFRRSDLLFQDNVGATPATINGVIGRANVVGKSPHNAQQSSNDLKPTWLTDGAKFDGTDDNMLSDWMGEVNVNGCIIIDTIAPSSIAATQYLAGTFNSTTQQRFSVGINPSGQIQCGLGTGAMVGVNTSLLNRRGIIGLTVNGTTRAYKMFVDGTVVGSGTFTYGTGPINLAARIGALSAGGTAGNFFGGSIRRCMFGLVDLTNDQITKITQQMLVS